MSVQLFLLCAELIAIDMRSCRSIEGIPVNDFLYLLNQYADDTNVASLFRQASLNAILNRLEWFRRNSGFALNYDKTELLRMGSQENANARLYTQKNLNWTEEINVLGIDISHDHSFVLSNYNKLIAKAAAIFKSWRHRDLSLIGKICVVNTLIASLFVYCMQVLPTMSQKQFASLDSMISQFIWNDKKAKIPSKTLKLNKKDGGMNLVDLKSRDEAIKISWINILENDEKAANLAYATFAPILQQDIWRCNLNKKDIDNLFDYARTPFWVDVLKAWSSYNYKNNWKEHFLWLNSDIRIQNTPVLWLNCYGKGLKYVSQLYRDGKLINIREANAFGLSVMQLNSLVSALPRDMKCATTQSRTPVCPFDQVRNRKDIARFIYQRRIQDYSGVIKKCEWWSVTLGEEIDLDFLKCRHRDIFVHTNDARLRAFQYRLLQNALILNIHLYRWKLRDSNLCSLCEREKETLVHLFYECSCVTPLLYMIYDIIRDRDPRCVIDQSLKAVLFNCICDDRYHLGNTLCLILKFFVYRQRCLGLPLNPIIFKNYIKNIEAMEKYIATKNNKLYRHRRKWMVIVPENTVETPD